MGFILGSILTILCMMLYYTVCIVCFWLTGGKEFLKRVCQYWFLISVILGGTILLSYWILSQYQYSYYWDNAGYWEFSINQMRTMFSQPWHGIHNLIHSIKYEDYNLIATMLVAFPLKIVGISYTKFCMITHIMFAIPAVFVGAACIDKIIGDIVEQNWVHYASIFVFLAYFGWYYLVDMRGMLDLAAYLPAAILIYALIDLKISEKINRKDVFIAGLLASTILLRRYYAFFNIAYVISMIGLAAAEICLKRNKNAIKRILLRFVVIGGCSLVPISILFPQFIKRMIFTDYKGMYVSWQYISFTKRILDYLGIFALMLLLFIPVYCAKSHWKRVGGIALNGCVVYVIFMNVQCMSNHHFCTVSLQTLILLYASAISIERLLRGKKKKIFSIIYRVTYIFAILFYFNIPICYCRTEVDFFPFKVFYREDMEQLHKMVEQLNQLTKGTDKKIYLTASGYILNSDIVDNINMPYEMHAIDNLVHTYDADMRDGFPEEFLNIDYVIATNPVELHLAKGTQEVVRFLNQEILNGQSPIGRHYKEVCTYQLENGVKAILYEKVSDLDQNDLTYIQKYFAAYYPDSPELFMDRITLGE